jgi:hypothetical protein
MAAVFDAYHAACSRVITAYDGFLGDFRGDGILAYFGFPRAREDDAERTQATAPGDLTWRRMRGLLDGFPNEMLRFTAKAYGPMAVHEAWDEFTGFDNLEFDSNTPLIQLFMPWFFHCWAPDPVATEVTDKSLHGVIPTKAYLATKGPQLDPLLRRYLESVLTAPLTFFEVLACNPGTGMTLRDIMTREEHSVTERGASRGMQPFPR